MLKKTKEKLFDRLRDIEDQVMINRDRINDVLESINKFVADAMVENNRLRTIIDSQNKQLGIPKHEPKTKKPKDLRDEDNYGHNMPEE